jgi:hypothetical protein
MNLFVPILFTVLGASPTQSPSLDLLKRAMDPQAGLNSYTASASLAATLHVAVPVHKTLSGTAYYLKPNHKIVFANVSGPLSKFKELTATTPVYAEARADYVITVVGDDGKTSTYLFVPSASGRRVKSLSLAIDDRSADVVRAVWNYTDGGRLSFEPTYATVGSYRLPVTEVISARFPSYRVDGTLRLSDYQLNASVPAGIFSPHTH